MVAKSRLEKLKKLEATLLKAIKNREGDQVLPQLARQYRETIREIEEIEGTDNDDEIAEILSRRESSGKAGAVRKGRAAVQPDGRTGRKPCGKSRGSDS